jgi:hypothetical protein
MRTIVTRQTRDQDEFPGSYGVVETDGTLLIIDFETDGVDDSYLPGEWASFTVTAD